MLYRSGTASFVALDDLYNSMYCGVTFNSFSPFIETFSEQFDKLADNGIIAQFMEGRKNFGRSTSAPRKEDKVGPQILTLDHLDVGFYACLMPLVFSFTFFLVELIIFIQSLDTEFSCKT